MQIIITHVNSDFDALASMIAAKKIYPDAQLVLSDKLETRVQRFLNIYRDMFDFLPTARVEWDNVTEMIIVDVASLSRIGKLPSDFDPSTRKLIVYDHHPKSEKDVQYDEGVVELTGAAVTLLLEEINKRGIRITNFEASLFGLGIYTDTGNFTYNNTTVRDLNMAAFLLEQGMSLEMVQRFSEETLTPPQQELLENLLLHTVIHEVDGMEIAISTYELEKFQNGLAMVTHKLHGMKGTDAAIAVVKMKNSVVVTGRANSERISLQPILHKLGGGGHRHAGSATVKNGDKDAILKQITDDLELMLKPAITAKELMTHPVKTLSPETTIEEAGRLMYRYGHSGYPIVEDGKLVGLITRRDLDKGNHHGLGHAPVKAYMTTNVVTITSDATLEEIQELVIEHNIGRLPVIENGEIIGIVTRTNIIEVLHHDVLKDTMTEDGLGADMLIQKMEKQLPEDVCRLLKEIGETASDLNMPVFLIGGIVRDILLDRPNEDIDIVVEGDGINLARELKATYGGEVFEHESFGTATWVTETGLSIDVVSSRLEYYEQPAALPEVEKSVLSDDLERRDFTINAMAIRLNDEAFGELIDPFGGQQDLEDNKIRILHNISFIEDPTRIFRAIRFEQRFGFKMDGQTEKFALESIDKVIHVSPQRVNEEMRRLFKEGDPERVIRRLFELHVFQQFGIDGAQMEAACVAADTLQNLYTKHYQEPYAQPGWFEYFLLPFYGDEKLVTAEKFALMKKELKLLEEVKELQASTEWGQATRPGDYHALLQSFSDESIFFVLAAGQIPAKASVIDYVHRRGTLSKYLAGADLVKAGLKPGPFFSEILLQSEVSQLNGHISSREEAVKWLTEYIRSDSMDERIQAIAHKAYKEFGLENYTLERFAIYEKRDGRDYVVNMEWFPIDSEEPIDEDLNPDGTASIDYDIGLGRFTNVIFTMGKNFSTIVPFKERTVEEAAGWLEKLTGLTYEKDFFAEFASSSEFRFASRVDGIRLVPGLQLNVEIGKEGQLMVFSTYGEVPDLSLIDKQAFELTLEEIEPIVKEQLTLVNFPSEADERFVPVYAIDEVYITADGKRCIPFDVDDRMTEVDHLMEWDMPLDGKIDRRFIDAGEEVTADVAFRVEKKDREDTLTAEQIEICIKLIHDALRMEYPEDSGKWRLKGLRIAYSQIEAFCYTENANQEIFRPKLVALIDRETMTVTNMIDTTAMLAMFDSFTPAPETTIRQEEAFDKMVPFITLDPVYVYDKTQKKYILCGLLDSDMAVDAVTGDVVELRDL